VWTVIRSPLAEDDIRKADAWWRKHRLKNPSLFVKELEVATEVLERSPRVGGEVRGRRVKGELRWIGLPRSEKKLYYRVIEEKLLVEVLRLGGARQKNRSKL
jgi:plasmid stabilization system protein ParE